MKNVTALYEEKLNEWGKSQTSGEYLEAANQAYLFANFLEHAALNLIMNPCLSEDMEVRFLWSSVYDAIREDLDEQAAKILGLREKVLKYERFLSACAKECEESELDEANYVDDKRWYYNQGRV